MTSRAFRKLQLGLQLARLRLREWLAFDARILGWVFYHLLWVAGIVNYGIGWRVFGFRLLAKLHGTARLKGRNAFTESIVRHALSEGGGHRAGTLGSVFDVTLRQARSLAPPSLAESPEKLLRGGVIVVKSQFAGGKGVLILKYSYAFPLFYLYFDVQRIVRNYHIVLEPSWSGYCNPEILLYGTLSEPVFVQAIEPYDAEFLRRVSANLVPIPLSSNWWTDYRVFTPAPQAKRDLDFISISSWADFKRHHRIFAAIRNLRRQGHELRGMCIGYPRGRSMEEIRQRAWYYGVDDLVDFREWLPPDEVASCLARSKVNLVWSRREGVNRAIVEGFFCDVPCLLPAGFNYGYHHRYINDQTGRFCREHELGDVLLEMTRRPEEFSPRAWALREMTPQQATNILRRHIGETQGTPEAADEYAVKINHLHGMKYWDERSKSRFEADYDALRECLRVDPPPSSQVATFDKLVGVTSGAAVRAT